MGKPEAELLLPLPPACSSVIQLDFHFYVSSRTLLNVPQCNHLSKISAGVKQKADSGLHCEERQLLITNTQSRTLSQHHHICKSRAAADFCRIFTGARKTLGAACDFFFFFNY